MNACLKVGRHVQTPAFWASLLPDEVLRNAISPDHFELAVGDDGEVVLTNLSPNGTLVNGKRVVNWVGLQSGDIISATMSMHDHTPIISFCLGFPFEQHEATPVPSESGYESLRSEMRSSVTPFDSVGVAPAPHDIRVTGSPQSEHRSPHAQQQPPQPQQSHQPQSRQLHQPFSPHQQQWQQQQQQQHQQQQQQQQQQWQQQQQRQQRTPHEPQLNVLDGSMPAVPAEGKVAEGSPRLLVAANALPFGRVGHGAAPVVRAGAYTTQPLQPLYQTQPLR